MRLFLFIILLCSQLFYTTIFCMEIARSKRQTVVSYGSPAYKDCDCGRPNTIRHLNSMRLIDGHEVSKHQYPWMVALLSSDDLQFQCGGSIINDRYVLSAAHCASRNYNRRELKVMVGKHNLCEKDADSIIFSVQELIPHPDYDEETSAADIMLIKLVMTLTFNHYVRPICLPRIDSIHRSSYQGKFVTVLGWGLTDQGDLACALKAVHLELYSQKDCPVKVSTLFCAGHNTLPRGTCKGDSGGPLQVLNTDGRFELFGLLSSGVACGEAGVPDYYTNIPYFVPWILKVTTSNSLYCWR